MKILFINLPYYGHIVPTIGLVQQLIKNGCDVTYMLPFDWQDKIAESGAGFYGYKNHRQLAEQMKNAYATAEKIIDNYDMIIYEQFFFLGKHLAEKHHKPAVRIFTAPATTRLLMDRYIESKGPLHLFKNRWISTAFTKDIAGNIPLKTDNWLDEIIFNPPQLNLVYTLPEYQPYADELDSNIFKFIGPSVYKRKEQDFDFVKTKPVIYIAMGTVIKGRKKFFGQFVDAFKTDDIDVIISVGKNFDVSKLKNLPENIHFFNYVPQLKVLEMADVFITHGGMNSLSEALVRGVPMVVVPFHSDQPVNAESMEKLGVGVRLDYKDITKDSIKTAVMKVLHNKNIKQNIEKIQSKIKTAPGNAGGAEMIINYYNSMAK